MVAGMFYPAESDRLRREVTEYLSQARVEPAPDRVVSAVVPHAGYIYSGPTAAHVYARIQGMHPKRVVILGRSHRNYFDGASIFDSGTFETPILDFPVDADAAEALKKGMPLAPLDCHFPEHSIEVQLPFLAVAIGAVPIVPILFGSDAGPFHIEFGRNLAGILEPEDLVIASTDLSHYLSQAQAKSLDKSSLDTILEQDCEALCRGLRSGVCSMCGAPAVVAAMACALERGARDWQLLDYRTSADASGDYERVVGYGAVSMELAKN